MCELFNDHWEYAKQDLNYRSPAEMIRTFCECRRAGANMLLNVGPMGDGGLRTIDRGILEIMGQWIDINIIVYTFIIVIYGKLTDASRKRCGKSAKPVLLSENGIVYRSCSLLTGISAPYQRV